MSGLDTGIQGDRSVACPWTLGSSPRVTVCGLLLAASVATAAPAPVLAQDRQVGLVKVVEGEAFALRADGRSALGVGQPIYVEDVVETEAGSLGLTFKDGTRLSIGPHSRLPFTTLEFAPAEGGQAERRVGKERGSP